MDRFEKGWEYDPEFDSEFDAEDLYLSLIPDEERDRVWSEYRWSDVSFDEHQPEPLLFAERGSEAELHREIRLSELWSQCQERPFSMDEFLELSMLVTEVEGIRGTPCADCVMLGKPDVKANWALASTRLCRGHLRFRLGHAELEGGGTHHAA